MTTLALVVGGTSGIGRKIASTLFSRGEEVVIAGRDLARAESVSNEIGKTVSGLALDLTQPKEIARAVRDLGRIDHLVLTAVDWESLHGFPPSHRAFTAIQISGDLLPRFQRLPGGVPLRHPKTPAEDYTRSYAA